MPKERITKRQRKWLVEIEQQDSVGWPVLDGRVIDGDGSYRDAVTMHSLLRRGLIRQFWVKGSPGFATHLKDVDMYEITDKGREALN